MHEEVWFRLGGLTSHSCLEQLRWILQGSQGRLGKDGTLVLLRKIDVDNCAFELILQNVLSSHASDVKQAANMMKRSTVGGMHSHALDPCSCVSKPCPALLLGTRHER